jgi:hypothetical protein
MKKPKPTDALHPTKADFIRAKHANLSFVYRPAKDEPLVTESELSRQLHSSVRTPNLETRCQLYNFSPSTTMRPNKLVFFSLARLPSLV